MIGIYPATTNNVLVYFASGPSRYEATTKFKSVEAGKSYFFNATEKVFIIVASKGGDKNLFEFKYCQNGTIETKPGVLIYF